MHRTFSLIALLLLPCLPAAAQETNVNLAVSDWGIPSALSAAPDLAYSAPKAADGKPDTGWVSSDEGFPQWLRVEGRFPVEVREVAFRQFPGNKVEGVGGIGRYAIEALVSRPGVGGPGGRTWQSVASGDASGTPADAVVRVPLARPVTTQAVRLVVEGGGARRVAVSEFQVLGPKPVLPWEFAPAWQGRLIWVQPSLPVPNRQPIRRYFRRSFPLEGPAAVREAWLLACAFDRLNALWLNNRQVLRDISYNGSMCRRAQVVKIPLDLLAQGENVLAASVDDLYDHGSQGLLAELVLLRADGTRTVIATDATWKGQEFQGTPPDWRKPGFKDAGWVACTPNATPGVGWHWLYNIPYPVVAPRETLRLVDLRLEKIEVERRDAEKAENAEDSRAAQRPQSSQRLSVLPVKPGSTVRCSITFECAARPAADYAVAIRLGQPSETTRQDYELFGTALPPAAVKTGAWEPGRHTVVVDVRIPEEAPASTPATLLVSLPTAAAGLATTLPGCRADAFGLHFAIPVDRGTHNATRTGPPDNRKSKIENPKSAPGFSENVIRTVRGTPMLHINGQPTAPVLWAYWYGNYRRYNEYTATGVKIHRPLLGGSAICAPGEEEEYYPRWFAEVDRMIQAALAVDPEIRVLPALWMDPNPQVLFDDPAEQMVSGRGQVSILRNFSQPDAGQVRPTFMSHQWRRRGAEGLRRLVEHMKAQAYAPRMVGLCLFAGRAGENYYGGNELNVFRDDKGEYDAVPRGRWDVGDFSAAARLVFREFLVGKYGTDAALQAAWQRKGIRLDDVLSPARFPREEICDILVGARKTPADGTLRNPLEPGVGSLPMDYFQCFSEAMIDTFAAWGKAVKDASGGRLLAGCYYGYTLGHLYTNVPGFAGHTAVARACRTPYLDYFVAPPDYDAHRRAGGDVRVWNIIDSLRLHNKIFLYEYDNRSFLAEMMPKTFSQRESVSVFRRDFAAALTHNTAFWWLDFGDGQRGARSLEWFCDPALADLAGHTKRVYDYALTLPDRSPSSQIAVFYHGETHTGQEIHPPTIPLNVSIGRLTLFDGVQRIGAPADLYNLADIPLLAKSGRLNQYRMCLFLNPFYVTAAERQSLDLCKGGGRTLVWLYAPGLAQAGQALSPERVSAVTGIPGIRWRKEGAEPTCRLTAAGHPLLAGLPAGFELAPRPMPPGDLWARFGNTIAPLLYVDPKAAGPETKVLGSWVLDAKVRPEMGAFCVREFQQAGKRQWASVYSAVPYLTPALMRAIARFAGVHVYRDSDDILFADRSFVAVHTGEKPAADTLRLPAKTPVYDVFARKVVAENAGSIRLDVPAYSTALYYLGDPAAFEKAVGK